jgi:hypothetical protein
MKLSTNEPNEANVTKGTWSKQKVETNTKFKFEIIVYNLAA